jgi:hypothetical protein
VASCCEASNERLGSMNGREFHTGEDFVTVSYCESFEPSTSTIQETDSVSFSPCMTISETLYSFCKVWRRGTRLLF